MKLKHDSSTHFDFFMSFNMTITLNLKCIKRLLRNVRNEGYSEVLRELALHRFPHPKKVNQRSNPRVRSKALQTETYVQNTEFFEMSSTSSAIISAKKLGHPWATEDPFLYLVHHDDKFPEGDPETLGVKNRSILRGRDMGADFSSKNGFSFYHGDIVPGFPQHPHAGFETLTIVRHGLVDHSDSEGAQARYGNGDVQWLTAGKGIAHSEMFPLLKSDGPNRSEGFQIWINLTKKDKRVDPHFTMLWDEDIPKLTIEEDSKVMTRITVVAHSNSDFPLPIQSDEVESKAGPSPPPHSYGSTKEAAFDVWTITMAPGAKWTMPRTDENANRNLYYFLGDEVTVAGKKLSSNVGIKLVPSEDVLIENTGKLEAEFLLLSAVPIGEPVFKHGPFVGNSEQDISRAYDEYRKGVFGTWPFDSDEPVHGQEGRFARYPDGSLLKPFGIEM
jgi:redox-sensitive bicupin YhaK (pirin superfamily)